MMNMNKSFIGRIELIDSEKCHFGRSIERKIILVFMNLYAASLVCQSGNFNFIVRLQNRCMIYVSIDFGARTSWLHISVHGMNNKCEKPLAYTRHI